MVTGKEIETSLAKLNELAGPWHDDDDSFQKYWKDRGVDAEAVRKHLQKSTAAQFMANIPVMDILSGEMKLETFWVHVIAVMYMQVLGALDAMYEEMKGE